MTPETSILSYSVGEPFDSAVRKLRKALLAEGLNVACELDTATRLRQQLGVALRRNIVLYVDDPACLLESTVMHPAGALFVPAALVITGSDAGCRVSLRSIEPVFSSELPAALRGAVTKLHERILAAVQRIGTKHTALSEISACTTVPA